MDPYASRFGATVLEPFKLRGVWRAVAFGSAKRMLSFIKSDSGLHVAPLDTHLLGGGELMRAGGMPRKTTTLGMFRTTSLLLERSKASR